jgi:hypothetical protein
MLRAIVRFLLAAVSWGIAAGSVEPPSLVHAASGIYRGFFSLELGMSVDELLAATPAQEVGRGEDRVFAVAPAAADIYAVTAVFSDDRLARIEATYSAAYSGRVSWDEFVAIAVRKYGTGFHLPTPGGDVDMWDDGRTTLILERRDVTDRAHAYVLTLVDDAVALERGGRCAPRLEV